MPVSARTVLWSPVVPAEIRSKLSKSAEKMSSIIGKAMQPFGSNPNSVLSVKGVKSKTKKAFIRGFRRHEVEKVCDRTPLAPCLQVEYCARQFYLLPVFCRCVHVWQRCPNTASTCNWETESSARVLPSRPRAHPVLRAYTMPSWSSDCIVHIDIHLSICMIQTH